MDKIQIIQVKGQRVLTTKQLAEAYDSSEEKIRWNFKYNKSKYVPGKHYILVEGEELRKLKRECEFHTLLKQAKSVCFWTEKGALLHAKSLNTDKAWEVYDYLVDFYFRKRGEEVMQQAAVPKNLVVDIPVNERAQQFIADMRKKMAGLDTVLDMYNRYMSEADYEKVVYTMQEICSAIGSGSCRVSEVRPRMISVQ